jgi:hypothetical protein
VRNQRERCGGRGSDGIMAQAAVESALNGDSLLTRRQSVAPRMKRKTPSELRVTPLLPQILVSVYHCIGWAWLVKWNTCLEISTYAIL